MFFVIFLELQQWKGMCVSNVIIFLLFVFKMLWSSNILCCLQNMWCKFSTRMIIGSGHCKVISITMGALCIDVLLTWTQFNWWWKRLQFSQYSLGFCFCNLHFQVYNHVVNNFNLHHVIGQFVWSCKIASHKTLAKLMCILIMVVHCASTW